jgi:hypothetical protein
MHIETGTQQRAGHAITHGSQTDHTYILGHNCLRIDDAAAALDGQDIAPG